MKCEAEVRRMTRRGKTSYPGASGSRPIHEYAYGRCTREAVVTVVMYPPRSAADRWGGMRGIQDGHVCRQHNEHLRRMADEAWKERQA